MAVPGLLAIVIGLLAAALLREAGSWSGGVRPLPLGDYQAMFGLVGLEEKARWKNSP